VAFDPPRGDDLSERRLLENERAFKRLNDKIEEHVRRQAGDEAAGDAPGFFCECADVRCRARLSIDVDEYTEAHREPGHYCVLPGHERPDVERVSSRRRGYVLVEKYLETG
jgi:hypothetical protein